MVDQNSSSSTRWMPSWAHGYVLVIDELPGGCAWWDAEKLRSCGSLQRWWGDEVLENCFCNYEVLQHRPLAEETQSARYHNIDAEEIKGMFSTLNMKSSNAKLCFLSSKVRSVKHGRRKRTMKRLQQSTVNDDLAKRIASKKEIENMNNVTLKVVENGWKRLRSITSKKSKLT